MQAKILSQSGADIQVQFTFDDQSTSTQTIHYTQDPDPLVDAATSLANFLRVYAEAYQAGVAKVAVASVTVGEVVAL